MTSTVHFKGHINHLLHFLLMFNLHLYSVTGQCEGPWIGPGCNFKCGCANARCRQDLTCQSCARGKFGPYCQYSDGTVGVGQLYPRLVDYDPKTCTTGESTVVLVTNLSYVTYLEVYHKEMTGYYMEVDVHFKATFPDSKVLPERPCRLVQLYVNRTLTEFYCLEPVMATEIVFTGPDVRLMCEVRVSLGRNMAPRTQIVFNTSDTSRTDNADHLYDEVTTCSKVSTRNNTGSAKALKMTLHGAVLIVKVLLSLADVGETIDNYAIAVIGEDGKVKRNFVMRTGKNANSLPIINDMPTETVRYIALSAARRTADLSRICEISAYGDCPPGKHFIDCSQSCPSRCNQHHCTLDGRCLLCREGFYGPNCTERCNCTRACDRYYGRCSTNCLARKFQLVCVHDCHGMCMKNSCDINGICDFGCQPEATGDFCEIRKNCTGHCAGKGFCYMNYSCVDGCKPGYSSATCEETILQNPGSTENTRIRRCEEGNGDDDKGVCQDHRCTRGWFAYGCQYRDSGVFAIMPDPALNDNDNSTCYTPLNGSLLIEWVNGTNVASWVRLVFETGDEVEQFRLTYDTGSKVFQCDDPQKLAVPGHHNAFDLNCFIVQQTKLLAINWRGGGSLCTVNVCAGRNLAAIEPPSLLNTKPLLHLVDGDISSRNCTALSESNKHELTFNFNREVILTSVDIYLASSTSITRMELNIHLGRNRSRHIVPFTFPESLQHFDLGSQLLTSLKMKIVQGGASVCEIQLIGDCSRGSYGDRCDGICSFFCYQERCTYDGRCFACALGFSGTYCLHRDDWATSPQMGRAETVTIPVQQDDDSHWTFAEFMAYLMGIFLASACTVVLIFYLIPEEKIPGARKSINEKSTSVCYSDIESDEHSYYSEDDQATATPELSSINSDTSSKISEVIHVHVTPESSTAVALPNDTSHESITLQYDAFPFMYSRRESEIN